MYTYIVVDDETLIRKGTIKKLEPLSDTIQCIAQAADGKEALQLIEQKNPDLIITDMKMPGMDGTMLLPILAEKYPDKRIIVISGYKDFNYMKHAITASAVDYILKPFSKQDLQEAVLHAVEQLNHSISLQKQLITSEEKTEAASYEYDIQMLKNLIMGYHVTDTTLTSRQLRHINATHNLILLTLHSTLPIEESSIKDFLVINGFGELALYLQHMQNPNLGFLILFLPEVSVITPQNLCGQIARILNHLFFELEQKVIYGISNTHTMLLELHDAFEETVSALNQQNIGNSVKHLFEPPTKIENHPIYWDKVDEFLFRIETGRTEQVMELIDELFLHFETLTDHTLYDLKIYCFWLSDQTRLMMQTYFEQFNPDSANSSMQNILNTMFSLPEIKQYYLQFYLNITNMLKNDSIYADNDPVQNMQLYIQKHYQKDLSIELLSCLFYMNRSYCSHIFKERTGISFVDYLNNIRLEKACQLLLHSDKKMYQIAKSVGYDNVKYFFRVFKKHYKITPEQYRIQNL